MRRKRPWWMDEVHPEDSEETPADAKVAGLTTEYTPPAWTKGMTAGQLAGHREEMRRMLREQREKLLGKGTDENP